MGRGECRKFPSKIFCLKLSKQFVGKPFTLSIVSGYRKCLCFRGLCHNFPSKFFCLTVPKHFVDEPFFAVCQKYAGNEKVYGKEMGRGECRKFPSKFFVSNCRTIPRGTLYSFISLGYRKSLCFRGLCHNFPWNFFVSEYRIIS